MFANALFGLWPNVSQTRTDTTEPKPQRAPIFIGDAIQPWGDATALLSILQRESIGDEPDR